jgi:hypothetical protein
MPGGQTRDGFRALDTGARDVEDGGAGNGGGRPAGPSKHRPRQTPEDFAGASPWDQTQPAGQAPDPPGQACSPGPAAAFSPVIMR